MNSKLKAAIIIVLIASLFIGLVVAASYLTSNTVNVTPVAAPTPTPTPAPSPTPTPTPVPIVYSLTLASNTTSPTVGENIILTASITPAVNSVTITFFRNNIALGTSLSNAGGVATYITTISNTTPKAYNATCTIP
jgi:flagellar basal body-associated protein FliL